MKGLKIVGFVLGGIVVLLAIGFALALMPSVQTWAVKKAVAGQPGMEIAVARVAAGFSAADVSDLRFVKDGMVVTAKGVSARYSAWDYLKSKRINVDSATIDELVIDLRNAKPSTPATATGTAPGTTASTTPSTKSATPAAQAEKKEPFQGFLQQARLPFEIRVASLIAKGRALLPNNQIATFELKGADIETGKRGKLDWTVDFADSTAGAALRALRSTGNASVRIATDHRIDSVEVDTIAAAMGPKLSADPVKLVLKAEKSSATADESYAATVSLVKGSALEPLVKTDAKFLTATREISGAWDVAVRSEQLAGLLAGLGLPEVAAKGAGKFSFKPDTGAVAASGDLEARTNQLQKMMPELAAIGAVQLNTSFDGGMADNVARLDKLNLEISGDGRKFAQISSLQKINYQLTEKRVTLADPKAELARISLQALPLAWAQAFVKPMEIQSGDLSMVLAIEAEPDGSRVRAKAIEPLAIRAVTVRQGDKKLVDRMTFSTRPAIDYSATKLSAQLANLSITMPDGDAVTGTVTADVTNLAKAPSTAFVVQLQAKVVSALKPYLPVETGPLVIAASIDGKHEGQTLQLAKTTVTVNRERGELLTALELQQPVRADLKATTFSVPNPTATAARVRLGEVPLAWAEPFVAKSKLGGSLKGATLDVAMRTVDDVTLTTAEPVTLNGVSVAMDGKPMLQNVDLSANLTATKKGNAITYEVRKVEVKQGQTSLAALTVNGEAKLGAKMTVAAKGNLEADVVPLMAQPVLAPFATLSRGKVAAAFDANLADSIQAKAVLSAKDLVAKQDNRALGDLEVNLTANVKTDGSGTINAPITMTNAARKSDIAIDGTFGKAADKETFLFTGKIASNQFIVDDFQPLAALAPAGEKPATPAPTTLPAPAPRPGTTPPVAKRDTAPFWKGVNGKVDLDLKRVLYGKDYVISGIKGSAVITDSKLSVDGLEGKFKENPFKLAAGITFAAQQPKPYALIGSADVNNFDVGEFLRASNPNEKPALESKFTISAKLNGNGENVGDLFKNAYGRFDLTGAKGVMRALARKGQSGELLNTGLSIIGAIGAARGSDTTAAVAEVARYMAEIPFDNIRMQVERGADLSFKLTSLEILSPSFRTTGSGGTVGKATDNIQNQPMQILLQMGAKGELAHLLRRVNMLPKTQQEIKLDDKGYELVQKTFTVGGTPANPDSSSLWKTILAEAAAQGLPALQNLLNTRGR